MNLNEVKKAVESVTQDEFEQLVSWIVTTERDRRRDVLAREKAQVEVVTQMVADGTITGAPAVTLEEAREGEDVPDWVNPGTDHTKMYRPGQVVHHKGRYWFNAVADKLNSWEPGAEGVYDNVWMDVTDYVAKEDEPEVDTPPPAPTPDGSRELPFPFEPGKKVTTGQHIEYQGQVYKLQQDHTMASHFLPNAPGMTAIYVIA